jgi:hypothetical protein
VPVVVAVPVTVVRVPAVPVVAAARYRQWLMLPLVKRSILLSEPVVQRQPETVVRVAVVQRVH